MFPIRQKKFLFFQVLTISNMQTITLNTPTIPYINKISYFDNSTSISFSGLSSLCLQNLIHYCVNFFYLKQLNPFPVLVIKVRKLKGYVIDLQTSLDSAISMMTFFNTRDPASYLKYKIAFYLGIANFFIYLFYFNRFRSQDFIISSRFTVIVFLAVENDPISKKTISILVSTNSWGVTLILIFS